MRQFGQSPNQVIRIWQLCQLCGRANFGKICKICPEERCFFFWEVFPHVIMQEFPLPTRADAVGLFCFSLHQHFHHGGCIFLFFLFRFYWFGFCNFVWCFIFQDYFLCNPSQPLQPFIAPLRGKSLWKAWKETSSVRISFFVFKFSPQFFLKSLWKTWKETSSIRIYFLVFKFSPQNSFEKFMKNVKMNINRNNFFLGFQVFNSNYFEKFMKIWKGTLSVKIYFLVFKFSPQLFFKRLWKGWKETSLVRISFLVFNFPPHFFWKVYERREKKHHQQEFLSWFSSIHLNFFWKMKSMKKTASVIISLLVFKFLPQFFLKVYEKS